MVASEYIMNLVTIQSAPIIIKHIPYKTLYSKPICIIND